MVTVRIGFHDLGNWHNKISLASIVTKNALKKDDILKLNEKELKELVFKTIKNLKKIEKYTIEAEKTISEFKSFVYENLNPDANILSRK